MMRLYSCSYVLILVLCVLQPSACLEPGGHMFPSVRFSPQLSFVAQHVALRNCVLCNMARRSARDISYVPLFVACFVS